MRSSQATIIDPWSSALASGKPDVPVGGLAIGLATEVCGALIAGTLAVLGLAGRSSDRMAAGAAIALGIALAVHGTCTLLTWRADARHLDTLRFDRRAIAIALGVEALAGVTAAGLGALVLAHRADGSALSAAACVLAIATLFGGAAQPQLVELMIHPVTWPQRLAARILLASDGGVVAAGMIGLFLGAFAVLRIGPALTLALAAYLVMATMVAIVGTALALRLANFARRDRFSPRLVALWFG
ncbi:MAG: hypothetical protein HOV81_06380 [Kofleriaceae bacterium]|nr:hypothetical protein [Kofleriaceae bacterium]